MKKILLSIFTVLLLAGSFGCLRSSRDASLTFIGNDGDIDPQYYSETKMEILPNYKDRTISVRYFSTHPKKQDDLDEPGEEDVSATGSLGGEYFDRFEETVSLMKEYSATEKSLEKVEGKAALEAKVSLNGEKYEVLFDERTSDNADLNSVAMFHSDLAKLLTEEEQI